MASRRDEVLKLLGHFRISMDPSAPRTQELTMRLELTFLHLHIPFEQMQLFAGMEGPEQAREVYPAITEWVKTEEARRAIWHAGQILRLARALPRAALQEHAATTVYHAVLSLWVYGIVSESVIPRTIPPAGGDTSQDVHLDVDDNLLLQRFTQFGSGSPCIRALPIAEPPYSDSVGVVQLRHPELVMGTVVGILRASHEGLSKPGLVGQLIQLMEGLQKATRRAVGS